MRTLLRIVVLTAAISPLFGCAVDSSIKRIDASKVALPVQPNSPFILLDTRPEEEKRSKVSGGPNGTTVFFGDDRLKPNGPELVRAALHKAFQGADHQPQVSLEEFILYVYDSAQPPNQDSLFSAARTSPGGAAVAPFLGLLVGGISTMTSEKTIRVLISGTVEGTGFTVDLRENYRGLNSEDRIVAALGKALDMTVQDVRQIARRAASENSR